MVDLIGNTPLVELNNLAKFNHLDCRILGKLESYNPTGSVKDRVALAMIQDAEERGMLKPTSTIIEPTAGNAGVSLAAVGSVKGYRVILTMPESVGIERRKLLKAYGAEVVLTPQELGMKGAFAQAEKLACELDNSFMPNQFLNEINPSAHYKTTGPEIWNDTDGKVDIFVAGVGSGGTITGAGKYLKEMNPNIKVVAVEPAGSPILSKNKKGSHKIQGLGAGFVPPILDTSVYDEVIAVENQNAFGTGHQCAIHDGFTVGISSGAALYAAIAIGKRPENKGKNIVVLLPDTGSRYVATQLYTASSLPI